MTRYAIISDVHANDTALEAVIRHIDKLEPRVDGIWALGDLVVYGPSPITALRRLRDVGILEHCVSGNNDYAIAEGLSADSMAFYFADQSQANKAGILERRTAIGMSHNWTYRLLTEEMEALSLLKELPDALVREGVRLLHANPCEHIGLEGNYIRDAADAEEAFLYLDETLCFFGHTHLPRVFEQFDKDRPFDNIEQWTPSDKQTVELNGHKMLINPGSVGQPRNRDNRAHYLVYDTAGYVQFHRVEYNLAAFEREYRQVAAQVLEGQITRLDGTLVEEAQKAAVLDTLINRFRSASW